MLENFHNLYLVHMTYDNRQCYNKYSKICFWAQLLTMHISRIMGCSVFSIREGQSLLKLKIT